VETVSSKFDLTLNLHADGEALAGWIDYDTDLFDERTILRLVDSYAVLLRGAAADPRRCVSALPLVDAVERRRLLTAGNQTACPLPETPVHTWIEARCASEPEAVAVSCGDRSLNCAELDRQANQLAHRLIALGVRPGDGVALGLERSLDMVTALLALFKAGAFYLPLDPALPTERRRFILEDSRVRLLLVDADDSSTPVWDGVRIVSLA